ncbi:hypothetical protein DL93DRAFT_2167049 [Clavulina sp. PMI_390]|nr:hypothetical protein DL93DRAFT_2167049 [Clavulina sp. PMI_390]
MASTTVVVQSAFLVLIRVGLYQVCQRALGTLVQDLRHLSSTTSKSQSAPHGGITSQAETSDGEDERSLPVPASASSFVTSMPTGGFMPSRLAQKPRLGRGALTGRGGAGSNIINFHTRASKAAFGFCFSENVILFVLVICQNMDVLSERTLMLNWRLSLALVVALVMLIIPLLMSIFITYRWSHGSIRRIAIFASIPYLCYLYLVTLIPGDPAGPSITQWWSSEASIIASALPSSSKHDALPFPLPQALARLALTGVLVLGTLSGFGAMRNTAVLFSSISSRRISEKSAGKRKADVVTAEDVSHAEGSLRRVKADLEERRAQLTRSAIAGAGPKSSSWMPNVFGGGDGLSGLRQEIEGLEALEQQMSRSVVAMKARRDQEAFAATFSGRMLTASMALFGIYCVYRLIIASINLLLPWSRSTPAAAGGSPSDIAIRWLLATFPSLETSLQITPERAVSLSRQFSLLMVGLIVMSSVRLVLRGVNQVLRVSSRNLGASLMLLSLAQVMSTYLLSTLIQLRTSFPSPAYPGANGQVVSLFSTLPQFEVFGPLFDTSFVISALVSGFVRWISGAFAEDEPWSWEMAEIRQTRR